jgi:hypothetical protein
MVNITSDMTNLNTLIEQRQGEMEKLYKMLGFKDELSFEEVPPEVQLKQFTTQTATLAYRQALLDLREGLPESKDIEKHTIEMLKSGFTNKTNRRKARIKDKVWNTALQTVRAQIDDLLGKINGV